MYDVMHFSWTEDNISSTLAPLPGFHYSYSCLRWPSLVAGHIVFYLSPSPSTPLPASINQRLSLDSMHSVGYQVHPPKKTCRWQRHHQATHQYKPTHGNHDPNDPWFSTTPCTDWLRLALQPHWFDQGLSWPPSVGSPSLPSKLTNAAILCISSNWSMAVMNLYIPSALTNFLLVVTYLFAQLYFIRNWFPLSPHQNTYNCKKHLIFLISQIFLTHIIYFPWLIPTNSLSKITL